MKKPFVLACIVAAGVITASANADVYTFQPNPIDLYDLEHGKYYAWKIDFSLPDGGTIDSASLFFDNIRNWNDDDNVLYVSLLDGNWLWDGLWAFSDYQSGGDNTLDFGGAVSLAKYENLGTAATDITYDFTSSEIDTLNSYVLYDGNFGISFDPDCHFYNDGVTLTIETTHLPVPGAVLLGSIGLSCSGWLLRRRRML